MTPTTCNRAEVQNCNETPCPVDCRTTGWTDWSGCSETCGDGVEYKDPIIGDQAQHGGEACPAAQERVCNLCASPPPTTTTTPATTPAPVDCVIDDFVWTAGSATCGPGFQTGTAAILTYPAHSGEACPDTVAERDCDLGVCTPSCTMHEWSDWQDCDADCGGGVHLRTRTIIVQPPGATCLNSTDTQSCHEHTCTTTAPPDRDCELGDMYSGWSACSETCGDGVKSRSRSIITTRSGNGAACPVAEQFDYVDCDEQVCPGAALR